jgi:lipid-A-disaccharide synthase
VGERAIMIVAGEASGDLHGAALCRGLRALAPGRPLVGMGGRQMAAAGLELLADVTPSAAVGGTEAVGGLPALYRTLRRLRAVVERERPGALVVIDFPEFNLRLAAAARRAGVPVVYFIPPQIWAWRPWRIRVIRRRVSLVLAVLPFETAIYRHAGVPVEFVGHPLLDAVSDAPSREAARRALGLPDDALVVGLLPGSRRAEVTRMLPLLREAAAHVAAARPAARFLVARAPTVDADALAAAGEGTPRLEVVHGATYGVMRAADLLLVTSGTATLEAALLGTPMLVSYRMSRLSGLMAETLARVPWISLPNLALGYGVVPEIYLRAATSERVGAEAVRLVTEPGALAAQRRAFAELAGLLGRPGVGVRAARLVLEAAERAA